MTYSGRPLSITVIIPVGPGHAAISERAVLSVENAWRAERGPFYAKETVRVFDLDGEVGRSGARNSGLDAFNADWYFLMDADDEMLPYTFGLVDLDTPATFGSILLNGRPSTKNRHPVTRKVLFRHGADGTLCMGFFLRGDLAQEMRFDESLDNGEDFDFYARLPDFAKIREPLVNINYRPGRQAARAGWHEACREALLKYKC
jgi:glycosyltransferase involved in cell wall biosynthesis